MQHCPRQNEVEGNGEVLGSLPSKSHDDIVVWELDRCASARFKSRSAMKLLGLSCASLASEGSCEDKMMIYVHHPEERHYKNGTIKIHTRYTVIHIRYVIQCDL